MQTTLFDDSNYSGQKVDNSTDFDEYQKIVLKSQVKQDKYTDYIKEAFDLNVTDVCKVYIPDTLKIDNLNNWNIGVICGASGSGKSTILKHLAEREGKTISQPHFDNDKCLISNFSNLEPKEATMLLSQMGLASVPTWIRPFNVLSNGEQYRASLAKIVSDTYDNDIAYIDEYTSVVDRNVAKSMSNALQKYIRKHNKRIILATCHYDIFDWLRPDWIYDLNKGGVLERGDYLRRERPPIELQVYRTTTNTWERFKKYHYMTNELNKSATCFVFTWNNQLVAFIATLPLPNGAFSNGIRGSRTVVLPDFQGLGLGGGCTDFVAGVYANNGYAYYTKTINPALGEYRKKSNKWEATARNQRETTDKDILGNALGGVNRPSYCYKYIGEPISGYENLILSADEMKYNRENEHQLTLF